MCVRSPSDHLLLSRKVTAWSLVIRVEFHIMEVLFHWIEAVKNEQKSQRGEKGIGRRADEYLL